MMTGRVQKPPRLNWLLPLLLLPLFTQEAYSQAPRGAVNERLPVDSKILGKPVHYSIYLPDDYATSQRYYPVVYLLHGYTDTDMAWIQFGEANRIADSAIAGGDIPPMIIVMPDAGVSWYINNHDNSVRYEDFFIQEFIPFIESRYRVRPQKQYRGVAGLSMGGFGALVYTLRHPEMFAACAAFSAAIYTDEETTGKSEEHWARVDSVLYGANLKGRERLTNHYRLYNPIHIVRSADPEKLKSTRLYIDCGDDDFLYKGNATFHMLLRDLKIPHEYRVRDGGHTWSYWRSGLTEGLKFIGDSFHR